MKKSVFYLYFFFFLFSQACSQQEKIEIGKINNNIKLESDTTLSYSIYLPNPKASLAFIFFDPSGNGTLPLTLYKSLADEFGIILIGNNNSANGLDFNLISTNFSKLLVELKNNYKIDEKNIALWGFSGGAKAAMYNAGFNNNIEFCIYGGSVINPRNNNIKLLGFNGKQDMNYTDLLEFDAQEQNNQNHIQIEFLGKHAWPDTTTAKEAFRWFLIKKMQEKEISVNKTFTTKSLTIYKKQVDQYLNTKQYIDALLNCNKAIYFLQSLEDVSYFTTKKAFILQQVLFKTQAQELQHNFEKESKIKMQFQADFFTKDTIYWQREIEDLWLKSSTDKTGIYNRLLGFLSLASYSYANRAFQANDIKSLEQILFIYHYSDPTNPEQAFMRAKLFAQKNEINLAKQALQEAIKLGIDKNRIANDNLLKNL